jgi:hypothetical protein
MQGVWEMGSAIVTLPSTYPDGTQADFNTYDQLVVTDFTVRMWELKEYEPRPDLQQRLRYPIAQMDYIGSAVNGVTKEYILGTDYNLVDGKIQWVPGREPSYDSTNERGDVFVASYYAAPVYIVLQNMRELRVTQEFIGGQKVPLRLPQQVMIRRDYLINGPEKQV